MASPHGSGGGGTGQPHSGTTSSSSSWDHAATAGPHPAPGELEREHLVSHAINGQEMVDTFQQAAASQQGSSSTCHQPHAWNSSSTAGPDNVSRNFLGAGDEGGSQQQTQPSACDAVPTSINGGIPRVELSSSSRGVGLHNPQHLGWMQTRAYQHGHSSHNGLTAAVMASQQPSQAPRAVGTFVGMPDGTDAGMAAPHAVRVPLSSALGQAGATELENFGIAGMGASGVGARGGQGAAWEGSGAAGSGAAGGLVASSVAASLHFSAQAAGGVVIQPPLPADSGARDELDAPLPLFAAPGGDGAGDEEEEEENDSVADRAPIAISIPDGFSLKARSWCCGRSETIRSICSKCNARWHCHISHGFIDMDKDRFICCFCDGGGRTQSGCKCKRHSENLRVRANSARRAQDGIVRRSAVERTATRRKPTTSAFKLPVQLDPAVAGDSSSGGLKAVYSVSTTARGDRYTVITNFDPQQPGSYKIVCCNNECTSTVHAQEPDLAENVQRRAVARCEHTIVVVGSETVPVMTADIPDAEPVVFGKDGEGVEAVANQAANELKLGRSGLENVLRMAAIAEGHGMPLLVRFGETRSYAVYHPGHRSIAEGWAVVLCEVDLQGGAGGARTSRRTPTKKSSQSFRCKANGATPCGVARKSTRGRCVHTDIAALGVVGSQICEELVDEEEGGGSGDEGVGSATSEYKRNQSAFATKVDKLLRVGRHHQVPGKRPCCPDRRWDKWPARRRWRRAERHLQSRGGVPQVWPDARPHGQRNDNSCGSGPELAGSRDQDQGLCRLRRGGSDG